MIDFAQVFWAKVEKTDGCWEWMRGRLPAGYGQVCVPWTRKNQTAPRVAWQLEHGPIPDGMMVCHTCDNPPCVRPDHLFLGTAHDNALDKMRKGRAHVQHGGQQPGAKITAEQAREIVRRARAGEPRDALAAAFGIDESNVSRISRGKTWRLATAELFR